MTTQSPNGRPGDVIVVEEHHLGEGRRACEILEVLGTGTSEHYRVRWDDGHESIYFPGNDAHTLRRPRRFHGIDLEAQAPGGCPS